MLGSRCWADSPRPRPQRPRAPGGLTCGVRARSSWISLPPRAEWTSDSRGLTGLVSPGGSPPASPAASFQSAACHCRGVSDAATEFPPRAGREEGAVSQREGWTLRTRSRKPGPRLSQSVWLITAPDLRLLVPEPACSPASAGLHSLVCAPPSTAGPRRKQGHALGAQRTGALHPTSAGVARCPRELLPGPALSNPRQGHSPGRSVEAPWGCEASRG